MNFRVRVGLRVKIKDKDDKTCGYIMINPRTRRGLRFLLCRRGCGFSIGSVGDIYPDLSYSVSVRRYLVSIRENGLVH